MLRAAIMVGLLAAAALSGVAGSSMFLPEDPAKVSLRVYTREVHVAVTSLTLVFAQADESVRSFQNGWLAPEGAASQFGFLHEQVRIIKADIAKAEPPGDLEQFHRQLGRSVSLTQQAMDAMHEGFTTNDGTYFELARTKLTEARTVLDRATQEL